MGDAIVGQGEPIDYWGISYGTVVGFNFIKSEFFSCLTAPVDSNLFLVFPEVFQYRPSAKYNTEYV